MRLFLVINLLLFFLAGCFENSLPPGVIARINGEDIQLRSLQTLLDSRSASRGVARQASVEEMKANYARALGTLIAHTLVRQELENRGISLNEADYAEFMAALKKEYEPENLEEFMAAASIPTDDWEKLVQDYHAMEIFRNKVLQPGIKIELEEIKHYYNLHKKNFDLPATFDICLATSESREKIDAWCSQKGKTANGQNVFFQCMDIPDSDLSELLKDVKNLEPGKCVSIKEEHGLWQALLPLKKNAPFTVSPTEAYALIERILLAEKQNEVFEKWLESRISQSSIQVVPALNDALSSVSEKQASD